MVKSLSSSLVQLLFGTQMVKRWMKWHLEDIHKCKSEYIYWKSFKIHYRDTSKAGRTVAERLCIQNNHNGKDVMTGLGCSQLWLLPCSCWLLHLEICLSGAESRWQIWSLKTAQNCLWKHLKAFVSCHFLFWVQFCSRVSPYKPLVSANITSKSVPLGPETLVKV